MKTRTAYMPLNTYPDAVSDDAVRAAVGFAASLGAALHVTTFAVNIPQMISPFGSLLLDCTRSKARSSATSERSEKSVASRILSIMVRSSSFSACEIGSLPIGHYLRW